MLSRHVDAENKRLQEFYAMGSEAARLEAATTVSNQGLSMQIQSFLVTINILPTGIQQPIGGGVFGTALVNRMRTDEGSRLDSPNCWTDLESTQDVGWYSGAIENKEKPVNVGMMRKWLKSLYLR